MISGRVLLCALGVGFLGLLVACGGASMHFETHWPPFPRLTSPGPVDVHGVLQESGTITLVGVRFDATAAHVSVNGRPAGATDLQAGAIVHLVGTVHADRVTGTATRVDCEAAIIGPVESLAPQDGSLVAMGQAVQTDANTVFDPRVDSSLLSGIDAGTRIRVHGWRNAAGEILATRLDLDETSEEMQVMGRVTSLDGGHPYFQIGGLIVNHGTATYVDLPGPVPADGMTVVVRGVLSGNVLIAREVRSVPSQIVELVQFVHLLGDQR